MTRPVLALTALAAVTAFAAVAIAALAILPAAAAAQPTIQRVPEPWRPVGLDSAQAWALEARALLSESKSDSIGPREARAFRLLSRIARRHFEALGPRQMSGAHGVLATFDSLHVDAEFAQDPELPQFCAVTFFNPTFPGYACVTFLFWWRGNELFEQTLRLTGGRRIQMDVWWTGIDVAPYEMGLVDYLRSGDGRQGFFTMLRISRLAEFWGVIQKGRKDVDLGGPGPARFVDLDHDAVPELVSWTESAPDPRFIDDTALPPLVSERTFHRSDKGFELLERRTVASPFATFVLFLRALETKELSLARTLSSTSTIVTRANTLRLGSFKQKDSWQFKQEAKPSSWDHRMRFAYGTPPNLDRSLDVWMKAVEGHWVVDSLIATPAGPPAASKTSGTGKSGGTR
ncbi:MAG: hypothetical protein ACREOU_14305 [Candidatus Eiseniibacteriota bacterium]